MTDKCARSACSVKSRETAAVIRSFATWGGWSRVWRHAPESGPKLSVATLARGNRFSHARGVDRARIRLPLASAESSAREQPRGVHARLRPCALALCCVLAACGPDVRELHYPSGALFERAEWDGAVRHGPRSNFFESGAREREVGYEHGLPDGEWRAWNDAGVLLSSGRYEAGRRTGEWTLYFDDGQLRARGNYSAGDKDGVWLYWRPDGSPDVEETWRAGTLLGARELTASSR